MLCLTCETIVTDTDVYVCCVVLCLCCVGADNNPCSDSYCGPSAFSEKCVKHVADYILTKKNIQSFIDFHSYSQLWMSPYGYTVSETHPSASGRGRGRGRRRGPLL